MLAYAEASKEKSRVLRTLNTVSALMTCLGPSVRTSRFQPWNEKKTQKATLLLLWEDEESR